MPDLLGGEAWLPPQQSDELGTLSRTKRSAAAEHRAPVSRFQPNSRSGEHLPITAPLGCFPPQTELQKATDLGHEKARDYATLLKVSRFI